MKATHLAEPELQFGGARNHVDPRVGLSDYGPPDHGTPEAPRSVRLGILGGRKDVTDCLAWIAEAKAGLPAKNSKYGNLFRAFPTCDERGPLRCEFDVVDSLVHPIPHKEIAEAMNLAEPEATIQVARLFTDHLRAMSESASADVIICVKPSAMRRRRTIRPAGTRVAMGDHLSSMIS